MEQKKILLVVISVGVFLVVAIGAALLVFGNGNNPANVIAANPGRPISAGASGNYPVSDIAFSGPAQVPAEGGELPAAVEPAEPPETAQPAENALAVSESGSSETALTEGSGTGEASAAAIVDAATDNGGSVTISVERPTTAAVPDVAPVVRVTRAPTPPATRPAPAPAPAPAATPVPAAAPKPAPRTYNDFWVQTGSFSTVTRAEGVKAELAGRGITSIIENRVIDGSTYYRVRVGPYTSQNEADYWLSLIKSINGFENSQIWQSPSIR